MSNVEPTLSHRPFLYLARKSPAYLKEGYKKSTNKRVDGKAKTGEVSQRGLVAHTEDWEGRIKADAAPNTIRYIHDGERWRKMTFQEMVERGYFILGSGPKGQKQL